MLIWVAVGFCIPYAVRKQEGCWQYIVTTGTCRYQHRWKWILPASRTFLSPTGPRGKPKNLLYRTQNVTENMWKSIHRLYIPFNPSFDLRASGYLIRHVDFSFLLKKYWHQYFGEKWWPSVTHLSEFWIILQPLGVFHMLISRYLHRHEDIWFGPWNDQKQ